jgi:hypothetical protein
MAEEKQPWEEGFDFSNFGLPFSFLPPQAQEILSKGIISSSKNLRMLYDEHLRQNFTEEQALTLVMSLQRDVLRAVAYVAAEVGKVMGASIAEQQRKPPPEG